MNVLVTGGAGYVGSHVVGALRAAGYGVVVLDNLSRGNRDFVRDAPLMVADLSDVELLGRTLRQWKVDAVMHFAAFISAGESVEEPATYYSNNVGGTAVLLAQMRRAGVSRLVLSSSAAVYGVPKKIPISEDHPTAPINPYGRSKLMAEMMMEDQAQAHALRYVSLRYFNAAGASPEAIIGEDHRPETHLIPICLQSAYGHRPFVPLYGTDYPTPDGTCVRDYIHVDDLAAAHLLALTSLTDTAGGKGTAYNVGTGRGYSVRQVIAAVEQVTGRPVPLRQEPRRPGDAPELVADAGKIRKELGWEPQYTTLNPIVETAARWFRRLHGIP